MVEGQERDEVLISGREQDREVAAVQHMEPQGLDGLDHAPKIRVHFRGPAGQDRHMSEEVARCR